MNYSDHMPRLKAPLLFGRKSREVIRYPKIREVIHNGSKPPKMGTYTPPPPYLVVKHN